MKKLGELCRIREIRAAAAALAVAGLFPGQVGAQAQVTDKWVTVVMPAEPPDLEGCNSNGAAVGRVVKYNVVEPLIQKNAADGALRPRLAESWEAVDSLTWRFKLRRGVTFHDGSPFNAETAKKSLDRNLGKAITCRDTVKFFGGLKLEVTALDDDTLQIKTAAPEPVLPMRLTGVTIVGPNTPVDKISLSPVGTGPYAFDSWQGGQQILLKRYDKYWGAKPQAEGARYIWRADSSVRAAMVKIGEADLTHSIADQDANDPTTDFPYLNSETSFLRIDVSRPPLNDRRVRLALNYAVDREGLRGTIMSKNVIHATQMVMPSIPGHNHEIDKMIRPYDPAKAKALLAEAKADGVPVDAEILLIGRPAGYPNAVELMEAVLTSYQAVGLNVKLINVELGEYAKWNVKPFPENRGPSLLQNLHDNNYGDPVFSLVHRYSCNDGNNSTYCNPEFDKELIRAAGLRGEERVSNYQDLFRQLYDDLVLEVWLYHMVDIARVGSRINFVPDASTYIENRIEEITFK